MMTSHGLSRYASWAAFVSAIATIVGLISLIMFFSLGQPWGTVNDVSSIVLALAILPVLLALYRIQRRHDHLVSLTVFIVGVLAMLVAIIYQSLLVLHVIAFAQTAVVVPAAFGLLGASLMVYGYRAYASGSLPRRLDLLGIVAGAGYVLTILGFLLGGQQHPLTSLGGLTAVVCYPIWAIGFARLLGSGKLALE